MIHEIEFRRLQETLVIDMMSIDETLIRLPSNQQRASELCAEALKQRDIALNELIRIQAAVEVEIRAIEPKKTAAAVQAEMLLHEDVIVCQQNVENAKEDAAKWNGLVDAIKQQGSSIKRLAELITAGFLSPNTELRKEISSARKQKTMEPRKKVSENDG